MKGKLVAISYTKDKKCSRVMELKNVNEKELAQLKNEQAKKLDQETTFENQTLECFEKVKQIEQKLGKHAILLAKTLYDNLVDRGTIDDDSEFQEAFIDYLLNGKEITEYPQEFVAILEKVEE